MVDGAEDDTWNLLQSILIRYASGLKAAIKSTKNELSDYHTYKNATHCWDCEGNSTDLLKHQLATEISGYLFI